MKMQKKKKKFFFLVFVGCKQALISLSDKRDLSLLANGLVSLG